MYTPSAYFMAGWAASTLNYLVFQPFIYATLSFIYVDFQDSSFENYFYWLLMLIA
jgi:hypothetical protein